MRKGWCLAFPFYPGIVTLQQTIRHEEGDGKIGSLGSDNAILGWACWFVILSLRQARTTGESPVSKGGGLFITYPFLHRRRKFKQIRENVVH